MKFRFSILLLSLAFFCVSSNLAAQSPTKAFYKEHKKKEGVFNMKIPGWLIWFGGGLAYNSVNDPDAKVIMKLAKRVKNFRLMISENNSLVSDSEMNAFVSSIEQKNFEELIFVKDGTTRVNIIGRNKNKKLKDLILLVKEEDEFVYMSMKTNIKPKHINQIIHHFMKDVPALKEASQKRKEAKENRRKKRRLKKMPQA